MPHHHRIQFLVVKRELWHACGPEQTSFQATTLQELRQQLRAFVRHQHGEGACAVLLVGAPAVAAAA
jgi:hypothetical protein